MSTESALVIFSGGQDSSTCLFWAKKKFAAVQCISFNYGQRHKSELDSARIIAGLAEVPIEIYDLPLLSTLTENSLTRAELEIKTIENSSTPNTLVEGRNLLFLTYAAIFAKSRGIKNLVAGVSQTDYSGYPDCREIFIRSANTTLNLAMDYDFVIHTPLMYLSKSETWKLADDIGILDVIEQKTVTCYNGIVGHGCGECPSCLLRKKGLDEFYNTKSQNYAGKKRNETPW